MRIRWLETLERTLLPPNCLVCGCRTGTFDLCAGCDSDLPRIARGCRLCARPLAPAEPGPVCGACLLRPAPLDDALAPFAYAFPVDRMLLTLKFAGNLPVATLFGELLARTVRERHFRLPDALVPVPLHASRLRERGFNQSLELARPVARALSLPLRERACARLRATPAQSTLGAGMRRANVAGAFTADASVDGMHVAVVDDVYTTGSTIAAVARALHDAGAAGVTAWCIARTVDHTNT